MSTELPGAGELARLLARLLPDEPVAAAPEADLVESAVLVPLLDGTDGPALLFTRRSHALPDHAGQIAFPGGVRDPGDANLLATALRETAEEVSLDPAHVTLVGALDRISTLAKYRIQPFLGLCPAGEYGSASPAEVARVFQVPLAWLARPENECEITVAVPGRQLVVSAWVWQDEIIWGATRRITLEVLARLRAATGLWP